ncbi:WD repeat-containing protein-like protein [Saccharata proteae CBS 121410]|uniref:WD repeat-containing protein-like protein n=1 Tax=Saccharata proteae CBS 121410 TaxID=1314787 RepID=A0A9P4I048_9PEZI|nr:WD repeat-containing protein-like protein [Saccharata proteae CBS 121410]
MRLDSEAPRRSPSPSQAHSNGSNGFSPNRKPGANKSANGSSHVATESNGSTSRTNGSGRAVPATFFGHDREEVTRILIQSLTDLGYHNAAESLSQESGYELEGPTVAAFRSAVLHGEWSEAESLLFGSSSYDEGGGVDLEDAGYDYGKTPARSGKSTWEPSAQTNGLTLIEGVNKDEMRFWMRQQKYLELLEQRDLGGALMVLRQELTPLHQDTNRLHALSSLMMCQSPEDLKYQSNWDGAEGESRGLLLSELSKSISPSVMIPEHRLAVLLNQVKENWVSNCLYHNTLASPSLYLDHSCDREDYPLKTVLELRHHTDEVWFLRFSNDGSMLATTGRDQRVNIYDTTNFQRMFCLEDHEGGICFLAWSPDDKRLISCSQDNSARLWSTTTGELLCRIDKTFDYPVTTAAWAPSGETFVTGSQDTSAGLCLWNTSGDRLYTWKEDPKNQIALRVHDVGITPDGQRLVVLLERHILVYDFLTRERIATREMQDHKLTSLTLSMDSQHMLISMNVDKICLMDIDTIETVRQFQGQRQTQFIIRSSFGGAGEGFVVSGSEDSRIYIWRNNGRLIEALDAHRPGCVNAVVWHPRDPGIFASAGDDRTVRIWSRSNIPCRSLGR